MTIGLRCTIQTLSYYSIQNTLFLNIICKDYCPCAVAIIHRIWQNSSHGPVVEVLAFKSKYHGFSTLWVINLELLQRPMAK